MVPNVRPSSKRMIASALRSSVPMADDRAVNATLPLDKTVHTSSNPAASKQRFRSDILALSGLTPRRKAT
jgi:hypothetical protein